MQIAHTRLWSTSPDVVPDLTRILSSLRPEDQYELGSVGGSKEQALEVVPHLIARGEAWVHWDKDSLDPVFMWGVSETISGVYGLWGFGTNQTRRAMPQITRWGMSTWLPDLPRRLPGIRRIEVRVPVSSVHSVNWLRKLGMEVETRLPRYGVWDEDFFQLAMTFPREAGYSKEVQHVSSPVVPVEQRCSADADAEQV